MSHTAKVDHRPDDTVEREAYRAYCTDCSWRGRWEQADPAGESMEARSNAVEEAANHEAETEFDHSIEPAPELYAITARVFITQDGWERTVESPTFYLNANVQGILNEAAASRVVAHWLDRLVPTADVRVTAVKL